MKNLRVTISFRDRKVRKEARRKTTSERNGICKNTIESDTIESLLHAFHCII